MKQHWNLKVSVPIHSLIPTTFPQHMWCDQAKWVLWGTCGLVETCRTHNPKVVSSSPTTANMLWALAIHFTFLDQSDIWYAVRGGCYNVGADKLCAGWPRSKPKWSEMIVMISWWQQYSNYGRRFDLGHWLGNALAHRCLALLLNYCQLVQNTTV